MMSSKAIQDLYPEDFAHCYGCGKNNPEGLQLKTYIKGDETFAHFKPEEKHTAIPGMVYGGLLASLIDCHATGSAAAFYCKENGIPLREPLPVRCVTGSLNIDFKAPTPMGEVLELNGKLHKLEGRKIWVDVTLTADGKVCATSRVLAISLKK